MNRSINISRCCIVIVLLSAVGALDSLTASSAPAEFHLQAESPQFWNLVDHNAKLGSRGYRIRLYRGSGVGSRGLPLCERRNHQQDLPSILTAKRKK